jgi:hypothetical protein
VDALAPELNRHIALGLIQIELAVHAQEGLHFSEN